MVVSDDVWRQIRGRQGFRFEGLGNRNLKGVGLIDLYLVTLDENPAATSGTTPKRGVSQPAKETEDPLDCCFAICGSQRRTRPGTLQ